MTLSNTELRWGALLLAGFALFCALSLRHLTTWPSFWYDEAVAVEIAHNFADYGTLNVTTAPQEFSPYGVMIGANGYPLTAPLAVLIKVFGFSLTLSRLYMLLWCAAVVALLFFFIRRFFTVEAASLAGLLFLSFSSFYANGRTVTGEIPGFFFLLGGVWLLMERRFVWAGALLGIAAATKPSLYLWLCIPAAVEVLFFSEHKIKNLLLTALGYAVPIALWLALTLPRPVTGEFFVMLAQYYKNPFGSGSIVGNIIHNIAQAPFNSTLLYFAMLGVAVLAGWYLAPKEESVAKRIYLFFAIVSLISFFYFLRSPAWLRYLVPLELCVLALLPAALLRISDYFRARHLYALAALGALIVFQSYVMLFHANILRSILPEKISSYINERSGSVGIINAPTVAALVPAGHMYQYIVMTGIPLHGTDALSLPPQELPRFMVISGDYKDVVAPYQSVLDSEYKSILPDSGNYLIYEHK